MTRIGRNDPCPCGSGKKYKKCCLIKDEESQSQVSRHEQLVAAMNSLQDRILRFTAKRELENHIPSTKDLYLELTGRDHMPLPGRNEETFRFMEWFINDFSIPGSGQTVVQMFLASKPKLLAEEMEILRELEGAYFSVYQIGQVDPGRGVKARDIFSGDEVFIYDVSLSQAVTSGVLVLTRLVRVLEEWQPYGTGLTTSGRYKKAILKMADEAFKRYRLDNPQADFGRYLKERGLVLQRFFEAAGLNPSARPKIMTSSGEEIVFLEARYDLRDRDEVQKRLDAADDFEREDSPGDKAPTVSGMKYVWLDQGESAPRVRETEKGKITAASSFEEFGTARLLGNLTLTSDRLVLRTTGRQRFQLGKERLEALLAGFVTHRLDSVQSFESAMKEAEKQRDLFSESRPPLPDTPPAEVSFEPLKPGESIKDALQNREFNNLEEVNQFLARAMRQRNDAPQAEMAGLSPNQVRLLLEDDWEDDYGALRFSSGLSFEKLSFAPFFFNTRLFLTAGLMEGGIKATSAGNLNRKFVSAMLESMKWPDDRFVEQVKELNKVINENDVFPLHVMRLILNMAGLIRLTKGRFQVTARGRKSVDEQQAGKLYRRLFLTYFKKFNLAYLSPYGPDFNSVQHTLAFSLFAISRLEPGQWLDPAEVAPTLVLPAVKEEIESAMAHGDGAGQLVFVVKRRIIEPLATFGLLDTKPLPTDKPYARQYHFRKSLLYDKFVEFEI